jgi:hypothetical protein
MGLVGAFGKGGRAERISRRAFLCSGGAFTLLATSPSAWARSVTKARGTALKRSHFKSLVGSKLRMTGGGNDVHVVLSEITDLVPKHRADDPDRFALLFTVSRSHHATPGIRTLHHDALGQVALFVSPFDRGIKARHYEAVINRSRS